MAAKPQPITRNRVCRSCGATYEYPLKESPATRHYCAECTGLTPAQRRVAERLLARIEALEQKLANPERQAP